MRAQWESEVNNHMSTVHSVEMTLPGGRVVSIETGKLAKQASGAVVVKAGDTFLLATATMGSVRGGIDFFPLTCDYEERKYAVGKIPGGFVKRGGRPSEKAVLTSRLIDRPLRPLFDKGMRNDVQVIAMPLSADMDFLPDVYAILGASAALHVSDIPWAGPIGAVRVGMDEAGEFICNPTQEQIAASRLDLVVAGTAKAILMVEAGAQEVTEAQMLDAFDFAHSVIQDQCKAIEQLRAIAGKPKREVPLHTANKEILAVVRERYSARLRAGLQDPDKASREAGLNLLIDMVAGELQPEFPDNVGDIREIADKVVKEQLRDLILTEGKRPDGRGTTDIRQISCEVGLLPRVHGSGLFTRGQTQVLTTCTLGSPGDAQMVDTLEEDGEKKYMHFYNFPPYSVGEARPMRGPGRREIGHGALAERALIPVLPAGAAWPYTNLLTSEVLESNGSTSMASTCGSTLALMDAGVPIKAPVAGIAMGLITDDTGEKYAVLTDIQGMEDFSGDMDFKVAGTADGITALQLDTKIQGIPRDVFVQGFEQARVARLHILDKINAAIAAPRGELSQYAPRIISLKIDPEQIGSVIGPGGKNIKKICADTGAKIDIEQDGTVHITSVDGAGGDMAKSIIEGMTKTLSPGEIYDGTVVRFLQFGAFVSLPGGKDALVHVSQIADPPPSRPDENLKLGDVIRVRVTEIDPQGRVNATARGLDEPFDPANPEPGRPPRPSGGGRGGDRGGRGGDRGGRGGRGDDRGGRGSDRGDRAPREADRPAPAAESTESDEDGDEMPRARFRPRR